jgi:protein-tyrosine phosphatase
MTTNSNDIKLKSVLNFRDTGGVKTGNGSLVKRGIIFRSASLDSISKKDLARIRELGIKTVIDLRGPSEQKKKKKEMKGVRVISMPLDFQGKTRERLYPYFKQKNPEEKILEVSNSLYLEIAEASAPVLAGILEILGSPDSGAILIHCQAGKDRTGILVALLHIIAGTERRFIVEDFLRSNDELIPYFKRLFMLRKIISFGLFPYSTVIFAIRVKEKNIESVIDLVLNKPGGIEGYLGSAGFDTFKIAGVREKLLENGKN